MASSTSLLAPKPPTYGTEGSHAQSPSRDAVDLINEMERQLNRLAKEVFGVSLLNPYDGKHVRKATREQRQSLATESRVDQLRQLIDSVVQFVDSKNPPSVAEPERLVEGIPSLDEAQT